MTDTNFEFYIPTVNYIINKSFNTKKGTVSKKYDEYTLSLCTEGEGHYEIDGAKYVVKKGDISFFKKNNFRTYKNASAKNWSYITISFQLEHFVDTNTIVLEDTDMFYYNAPYEIHQLFYKAYETWIGRSLGYHLQCRTIIQEIIYKLLFNKHEKSLPEKHYHEIEEARLYIQNHIKENIDFDALIENSKLSPTHFRRLFKKATGYSPRDYYNYIKVTQAFEMLRIGIFNVSEVADEMGYSSVYYFSSIFKKYYNRAPTHYVNKKKNNE